MIMELSDKDIEAIAWSRAQRGKYYKRVVNIWGSLFIVVVLGMAGYAVYVALNELPTTLPKPLFGVLAVFAIISVVAFIVGTYVRAKQVLKQLKQESEVKL